MREGAGIGREIGAHRACPVPQQPDGRRGFDRLEAGVRGRQGQRLHLPQRLTGDTQRFAAGSEDPQSRALPQYPVRERGHGFDHMLTVVQDQQGFAVADRSNQPVHRLGVQGIAEQRVAEPDRGESRLCHITARTDRSQLHQPGAVRKIVEQGPCRLPGEPGFPATTGPGQRGEAMVREEVTDGGDIGEFAYVFGQFGPQVRPALGGLWRTPFAAQQRHM